MPRRQARPVTPDLSDEVRNLVPAIVDVRRQIHRRPERGFDEVHTASLIAARLKDLGLVVREHVAGTGVVGVLRGRSPGRTLLMRADMDALPVTEATGLPFASQTPGMMHACGHDAHVAMLLGAAGALVNGPHEIEGAVVFCFQPAEEGPGGAFPMIEEGVLDDPRVDAAIGLHVLSHLPTGTVAVSEGPVMASVDEMEIVLSGTGGHGASPHKTRDTVVAAAHLVIALQTVASRRIDPLDPVVVTVASIHGGTATNIIPDQVTLRGTVRTFDEKVRARVEREIREITANTARAFGVKAALRWQRLYPPTVNDGALTRLVSDVARTIVGEQNVVPARPTMGGEDMSYFLRRVPGCFAFLGVANAAKGIGAPHHSPQFDVDEDALPIGTEILVRTALRYLSSSGPATSGRTRRSRDAGR